jgi:hypothetical protein
MVKSLSMWHLDESGHMTPNQSHWDITILRKSGGLNITSSTKCIGISTSESYKIHARVGNMATGLRGNQPRCNTNIQKE